VLAFCMRHRHDAFMPSITIRDVPDEVRDELASRARLAGQSLQEYLQAQLAELTRRPDPSVLMQRVGARKRHTGSALSADRILELRDADRR